MARPQRTHCKDCNQPFTDENRYSYPSGKKKNSYCKSCMHIRHKGYRQAVRDRFLKMLGGKCVCCGESTPEFLTLDHVQKDGATHRKSYYPNAKHRGVPSTIMYAHVMKEGAPADRYRLLCYNCNCALRNHSVCPHQKTQSDKIR